MPIHSASPKCRMSVRHSAYNAFSHSCGRSGKQSSKDSAYANPLHLAASKPHWFYVLRHNVRRLLLEKSHRPVETGKPKPMDWNKLPDWSCCGHFVWYNWLLHPISSCHSGNESYCEMWNYIGCTYCSESFLLNWLLRQKRTFGSCPYLSRGWWSCCKPLPYQRSRWVHILFGWPDSV